MELKEVLVVTKPIQGSYGSRMNFQGTKEKQTEFITVCRKIKGDAGLMRSNDTTYEFIYESNENVRATAFQVAEELNLPVLFL